MGKRRKLKPRNYIGNAKVVIKHHVILRYMERAGVSFDSFEDARNTLIEKFRNSKLGRFQRDGSEIRQETRAAMNKRLTFVSYFNSKTNTFIVVTCYLQGSADNWWKNDGLIIKDTDEDRINKDEITEEMKKYFREEVTNG